MLLLDINSEWSLLTPISQSLLTLSKEERYQSFLTQALEIKNFLGFKVNKRIDAPEGVLISKKEEEKNNVTFQGIDLEKVSQVCARVHQATIIQEKDLRSFLDGIYVQDARLEYND